MPATIESQGTERYVDFEEKRYNVRVVALKPSTSPPPDNREQYEWNVALEGSADPETLAEIVVKFWTSQIWNDGVGTESHLVLVGRGLIPTITRDQFEAMDYPEFVGLRGSAIAKLNPKGYPAIDKTTFKPVGNAAPKNQATLPQTAAPAPAPVATPTKPARPGPLPRAALRTEAQVTEMMGRASANDPPLSAADIEAWVAQTYPGTTVATLTREQAEDLINAMLPF